MTGTPINNNIGELFNLMNFLDPDKWNNSDEMKRRFEVLNEELVQELHGKLRPYFLRRVKSDVMKDLPRKVCRVGSLSYVCSDNIFVPSTKSLCQSP
jgi:chromodomain-helicase-DNA-binding protein 4